MRYSREELTMKPVSFLINIDIKNQEEEELVQEILDAKRANMPSENPLIVPSTLTDNMTPEKEKILQAKIDAKMGKSVVKSEGEAAPEEPVQTPVEPVVEAPVEVPVETQTPPEIDPTPVAKAAAPKKARSVKK